MTKRLCILLTAIVTGFLFISVGVLIAADVPEKITIDEAQNKKGPVAFDHQKHVKEFGATCTDCHHSYKDGKNVWKEGDKVEKCSACHDLKEKKDGAMKLQNAFHKNCKNCHKEKGKGPFKKCNDCHAKK